MKKILNFLIILFLTLAFFVGCGQATGGIDGGIDNGNSTGSAEISPLFNESEAPITISSLALTDLSDGTWEFKMVYSFTSSTSFSHNIRLPNGGSVSCNITSWAWIETKTFTKSGSSKTVTAGTETQIFTMDNANKAILNSYAATQGQTLSWNGNTISFLDEDDKHPFTIELMFDESEETSYTTKKNATGTRYIVKNNYGEINYLKKLD